MVGRTLIGGFDVNGQSFAFINFAKLGNGQAAITANFAYPAVIDVNGYPNNSGASLSGEFGTSVFVPHTLIGTGNLVIKWTGDGAIRLNQSNTMTVSSKTGCTTNSDSASNLVITSNGSGSSPRVVLNMAAGMESRLDVRFPTGKTYTNMADLVICRESQEALLDGGAIFNPDFINLLTSLNPKVLRLMDWSSVNGSLISLHDYRHPVDAFSYRVARWDPRAWAGTATLSSNAYTCSATPSGFDGTLVHGATVQAQIEASSGNSGNQLAVSATANNGSGLIRATLADTSSLTTGQRVAFSEANSGYANGAGVWTITVIDSTHVDFQGSVFGSNTAGTLSTTTFSCNGSAAKLICSTSGVATLAANALCTFIYDSILDAWRVVARGMGTNSEAGAVPVELQVALCNELGVDYHSNFPFNYTDASVQDHAEYVRDNLNPGLTAYYEYSNEIWNTGAAFTQTNQANFTGLNLGFLTANGRAVYGWYGLRVRQIMGIITTVYAAQSKTNYKRVLAFQAFGNTTNTKTYRLDGTDLVTGNAKYNAWTGSVSYNSFPDRPIDYCDAISYATYFQGGVVNHGNYAATGTYTELTAAADDYESGDPGLMSDALDWMDSDLRTGTSTVSGNTLQTIGVLNSTIYPAWEGVADDYDAQREGAGMAKLGVIAYEGGYEGEAPTTAQCTTIGISTSYATSVAAMIEAYKNDVRFLWACADQLEQHAAAHSARSSVVPAWFALQGASDWSMLPGATGTTPYQSYHAHRLYNARLRRKRLTATS